jgi:preprotein translocase subunit SecG
MKELKEEIERRHRYKRYSKNTGWMKFLVRVILLLAVLFLMNNLNKRYHIQLKKSSQKIMKLEK